MGWEKLLIEAVTWNILYGRECGRKKSEPNLHITFTKVGTFWYRAKWKNRVVVD